MEQIQKLEIIEPRNERWVAVDQAMELARMLPDAHPARDKLLHAAANAWIGCSMPIAMFSSEVGADAPERIKISDREGEA